MTEGVVDITGFVKFTKVHREARTGKNPRTGEPIAISAKYAPKAEFKKAFKDQINE